MFSREENEAGMRLLEEQKHRAEAALANARGRREKKQARADLNQAELAIVSAQARMRRSGY